MGLQTRAMAPTSTSWSTRRRRSRHRHDEPARAPERAVRGAPPASSLARSSTSSATTARSRAIVIAANGPVFSVRARHRDMVERDLAGMQRAPRRLRDLMRTLQRAARSRSSRAVQGVATAAGCQLVASADLAVAADTARASRRRAARAAGSASRRWSRSARAVAQARARAALHRRRDRRADGARLGAREPRRARRAVLDEAKALARAREPRQRARRRRSASALFYETLDLDVDAAYAAPRSRDGRRAPLDRRRRASAMRRSSRSGPASTRRGADRSPTGTRVYRHDGRHRRILLHGVRAARGVPHLRRRPRHPRRRLHQVGARPRAAGDRRRAPLGARLLAPADRRGRPADRRVPDLPGRASSRTRASASACASPTREVEARVWRTQRWEQRAALPARAGAPSATRGSRTALYDPTPRAAASRRRSCSASAACARSRKLGIDVDTLPLQRGARGLRRHRADRRAHEPAADVRDGLDGGARADRLHDPHARRRRQRGASAGRAPPARRVLRARRRRDAADRRRSLQHDGRRAPARRAARTRCRSSTPRSRAPCGSDVEGASEIIAITNGVHAPTWQDARIRDAATRPSRPLDDAPGAQARAARRGRRCAPACASTPTCSRSASRAAPRTYKRSDLDLPRPDAHRAPARASGRSSSSSPARRIPTTPTAGGSSASLVAMARALSARRSSSCPDYDMELGCGSSRAAPTCG